MRGIIVAAVVGISASVAVGADEYKVKFTRPFKPGDSVVITTKTKFKSVQKAEIGGQANEQKLEFAAELEGTETIDAVNESGGEPTRLTIKVTKCTKDGAQLLPAGSTVTAENKDGKTEIKVDGNDPTDEQKPVLSELIDTSKPDAPSTDEVIGTDKAQKVGDAWPIHSDTLAKEISDGPIQLTGDQLKGECKLKEVKEVDGKPSEVITAHITADVPAKDPNNGANVHDLKFNIDATQILPVDDTSHVTTSKMTRTMTFKMDSPGPVITISYDETREETVSEVKK